MTQKDAIDWWSGILNLFVKHRVDLSAVEDTFLQRTNIRPGTQELFRLCADNDIPTIILSAGIRDVIDIWCRKYLVKPSLVLSTSLIVDSQSRIVGWQRDTLIHAKNKSEANHPELVAIRRDRPNAILVGDGLDDADMASGQSNVIRTRVLDPRGDEPVGKDEERKTLARFDATIMNGSLEPLCKLVEFVIANH